jgi:hypothetical protein
MKKLLLYLWQLPQNLIGFFIIKIMKAEKTGQQGITYYVCPLFRSGVSLGNYIIFDNRIYVSGFSIKHEKGHQKQSLYLGWFYLLLIGLPSIIGNILRRFFEFNYYRLPWERWADLLGDVKR